MEFVMPIKAGEFTFAGHENTSKTLDIHNLAGDVMFSCAFDNIASARRFIVPEYKDCIGHFNHLLIADWTCALMVFCPLGRYLFELIAVFPSVTFAKAVSTSCGSADNGYLFLTGKMLVQFCDRRS